jgi:hypothetical protein
MQMGKEYMDRSGNGAQTGACARERVYVPPPPAREGEVVPLCRSVVQLVPVRG